jgi:plastocyanin
MGSSSALIALLVVLGCAAAATATTYTVGEGQGWTVGPNYSTWASGKPFVAGDKLVFNYASQAHTVTEVTKSDYDACSSTANGESGGSTTMTLKAGDNYYICTVGTHCSAGMKLAITAADSSSGSPPATGTQPTTPSTTPSGAPARLHAVPVLAAAAGVLVKLALF